MICLTKDELLEISGYRQRSAVSKWLRKNGFTFRVAADGWPRVDRTHYHTVMGTGSSRTLTVSVTNVAALTEAQRNGKKKDKPARPA